MENYQCTVCGSFVVETTIRDTVFGRCFHCGYSWERNLFPFQEDSAILSEKEEGVLA